jgi:hypothetical protein
VEQLKGLLETFDDLGRLPALKEEYELKKTVRDFRQYANQYD